MKHVSLLFVTVFLCIMAGCEKETMLAVDQASLTFTDAGGSNTITLTANKLWSASSNQSWCKVSPSGGEDAAGSRISITCDANTTYDARSATVTFTCSELTKIVSISQAANNGLLLSKTTYDLTNTAQQIEIPVQANVKFSVDVDAGCKDWIKHFATKGLTTSTVVLDISENDSYDGREGKVTIKQEDGSLSSTVTIRQGQTNYLEVTQKEYIVDIKDTTIVVEVTSNVAYSIEMNGDAQSFLTRLSTKGLSTDHILFTVSPGDSYTDRTGEIIFNYGDLSQTVKVHQYSFALDELVQFEDPKFKAYCVSDCDSNEDGEVSLREARNVRSISIDTEDITSLKGIEYFENLEYLYCSLRNFSIGWGWETGEQHYFNKDGVEIRGQLKTLDVSKNRSLKTLYCDMNQIESLDVSNCPLLETLSCTGNDLSSLKIDNCTKLNYLYCERNSLTSLGIGDNTTLKMLYCYCNYLSSLDVSNNSELTHFWCDHNELTVIDISHCPLLVEFHCGYNQLQKLDVAENISMESLDCSFNSLQVLNLGSLDSLTGLYCNNNNLTSLDISRFESLVELDCSNNQLTTLDVSNNTALAQLICYHNCLTSLDVSQCTEIKTLLCDSNALTSLIIGDNYSLSRLSCSDNLLSVLDVSRCSSLFVLDCINNKLASLDISNCPILKSLECSHNKLTSLDVSKCTALKNLFCSYNELTSLDVSNCTGLTWLECSGNMLTSLDVSHCLSLNTLYCDDITIYLKTGQTIPNFHPGFDAVIQYVD